MHGVIVTLVVLATAIAFGAMWRLWHKSQVKKIRKTAIQDFEQDRSGLAALFLQAAGATGKPRGLTWKNCELSGEPLFATDRVTGELYALVTATISFEAIAGGDMEDVEAVSNLRCATAIFVYRDQHWTSDGRAVFNLEPAQSLERFQESLSPFV
ncbi:hypothetical protein [Bythopirellula polymerisocia]|uniref:Uncharacterized protein n=1 Tax=Bythopirellula polymerisocia TaxID=2528003 RepID=A0A5C6CS93_9BACT|nr:hypothetical protein [Bythopirellula polymerisocia]TWU27420.1 hypothetical protein Pla144_21930 [Bythopirellula polymerisocia]